MNSSTKITLHSFEAVGGRTVYYARLQKWTGNQLIGQSLLLCRLTPEQLASAIWA